MMARHTVLVFACWTLAIPSVRADSLEDVRTRMDRFAKDFKSFAAKMTRTDYQKVLDEKTTMQGVVRMQRTKDGTAAVMEFSGADAQIDFFDGRTGGRYFPKANTEEIYDIGKKGASLEQIILLGFGASRAELTNSYDIALGGSDTVEGTPVTRIELTPKSKDQKNMVARIELWIPMDKGYPVQEKITEPSKNYTQVTYSDMKVPAPANSSFKPVVPADVHKITPQK
jgi:outer membrane lipoprotein-sorting protein